MTIVIEPCPTCQRRMPIGLPHCPRCQLHHPPDGIHAGDCTHCKSRPALKYRGKAELFCAGCKAEIEAAMSGDEEDAI